jgi:hypothetical protein
MLAAGGGPDVTRGIPERSGNFVVKPSGRAGTKMRTAGWANDPRTSAGGAALKMPLLRYFLFTGGVLVALLFALDAWAPSPPVAPVAPTAIDYLPVVRIHSERKWPERIVFDTRVPAIIPGEIVIATDVPAPIGLSAAARIRDTFAQFEPAYLKRGQAKLQQKRKLAKGRVSPSIIVAQQPRFGFLASGW